MAKYSIRDITAYLNVADTFRINEDDPIVRHLMSMYIIERLGTLSSPDIFTHSGILSPKNVSVSNMKSSTFSVTFLDTD